jgi:hypothetical protein
LLPATSSFDSATDQRLKLASFGLTYRSVNPGTETIIMKERGRVKRKNAVSKCFQQVFENLFFNDLQTSSGGFLVHKSARREIVSSRLMVGFPKTFFPAIWLK